MTAWCGFGQKNEFAAVDSGVIVLLLWSDTVCLLFEVSAVFEIFVIVYCLLLLFRFFDFDFCVFVFAVIVVGGESFCFRFHALSSRFVLAFSRFFSPLRVRYPRHSFVFLFHFVYYFCYCCHAHVTRIE